LESSVKYTPYPTNTWGSLAFTTAVAVSAFIALSPLIGRDGLEGLLFPGILAALIALATEVFRRNTIRTLLAELASARDSRSHDVLVNGVRVGSIARTNVISLKLDALRDARNYAAQFVAIASMAVRCAVISLVLVPVLVFWLVIACALISPAEVRLTFTALTSLGADGLSRSAASITQIAMLVFVLVVGMRTFGKPERSLNAFRRSVHTKIRERVGCSSEGVLSLRPGPDAPPLLVDRTRKTPTTADAHHKHPTN